MNNQPCTRHCRRLGSPKAQAFNPNLRVMATPLFESRRQIDMHRGVDNCRCLRKHRNGTPEIPLKSHALNGFIRTFRPRRSRQT